MEKKVQINKQTTTTTAHRHLSEVNRGEGFSTRLKL